MSLAASPLTLDWPAREGCPSEEAVAARVQELVGGEGAGPERLRAAAELRGAEDRWEALLSIVTAEARSERRFEADSCAAVADAVAVILALSLERAPVLRQPIRKALPAGPNPPRAGTAWHLGARLVGTVGLLPGLSSGVSLEMRHLFAGGLGVSFGATAWLPPTVEADFARVRVGLLAGELAIGQSLRFGIVELRPEARVELGRFDLRGSATGFAPVTAAAFHIAVGASLEGAIRLTGPLWGGARIGGYLTGARPEVVVDGAGRLFRPGLGSLRVALGIELRLD